MTRITERIYHITEKNTWEEAQQKGVYTASSLQKEGFIHFSTRSQLVDTANCYYKGQSGLVVLQVDPQELQADLRYDSVVDRGRFPHLYGPLNLNAVKQVFSFNPNSETGLFTWPEGL